MSPLAKYTGLAYDFMTYNCWDHVRNVLADVGIATPEFGCQDIDGINGAFEGGHADSRGLVMVMQPRDFDAVLMATEKRGRLIWHAGVYHDGMVSHCDRWARQVIMEPLSALRDRYERVEFWR
jgi:hypothetical protein